VEKVRVSVVIPTFGRPELLARAVTSVLAQTMADLECIVVIDGHDPATLARLATIADPRLRHIAREAKGGAGRARDTGADAAVADWVAFLDDDDEWLPTKLERQLAIAPADGRAVVMTLSHVVTPEGAFVRPVAPYDGSRPIDEWLFDRTTWLSGGLSFLQTSSLMIPRALFATHRFELTQHEEWRLVIRAIKEAGYRLLTVLEPLTIHYAGQPRRTLSHEQTWSASLAWADAMGDLLTPRAHAGFVLAHIGQNCANIGDYRAAPTLVRHAYASGRPTGKQLFRFVLNYLLPRTLRRRARAALQPRATPSPAANQTAGSTRAF
jgi:glycosyltransferase involved in cell wall biosynthesis